MNEHFRMPSSLPTSANENVPGMDDGHVDAKAAPEAERLLKALHYRRPTLPAPIASFDGGLPAKNEADVHDFVLRKRLREEFPLIPPHLNKEQEATIALLGYHVSQEKPDTSTTQNIAYLKAKLALIEQLRVGASRVQEMLAPTKRVDEEVVRAFFRDFDEAIEDSSQSEAEGERAERVS